MPIGKQEFENGKLHSKLEEEIVAFLDEREDRAFTSQEIMEGIRYHTEFGTPEITKMSTFAIADFTAFLYHLVEKEKIKMKVVRGRMYFMPREKTLAKCPKCGTEVANPRKIWDMTGRPNKKGQAIKLSVGLFNCPKDGTFRTVLSKQTVFAAKRTKIETKKEKTPRKKTVRRKKTLKKTARKKKERKKPEAWQLI